jgi:MraZ protein
VGGSGVKTHERNGQGRSWGTHALLFTGTYEHTIDAKQRLAIPSDVRDRLDPQRDGQALYITLGEGPTLRIYTEKGFERRAEQLEQSELPAEELLDHEEVLFSLAHRVELDKQGRVRLPEQLLKWTDPGRDIVLIGAKDHLQIHPRQQWLDRLTERLQTRPELLGNPRRLMKRNTNNPVTTEDTNTQENG